MAIAIDWISQTGKRTDDNRDYAGVGFRAQSALCIVLDGSTTGEDSGQLAAQIAKQLIDWYVTSTDAATVAAIVSKLKQTHESLSKKFPQASTSYMVVHLGGSTEAVVLHAGDCLLGRCRPKDGTEWLNQPHTLANVTGKAAIEKIAVIPARHRLTRSYRSKEFLPPDDFSTEMDGEYLVATDGFWAELTSADQARFSAGNTVAMPDNGDDRSVLRLRIGDAKQVSEVRCVLEPCGNLYVKKA